MARTRAFDLDEALDRMVEVFWRKGFAATSINDLEAATTLNRTSLYAALGNKDAVFIRALKHYAIKYNDHLIRTLRDTPSATHALVGYFDRQIEQIADPALPGGCLLANSVVECRQSNLAFEGHIVEEFGRIEAEFFEVLQRGQKSGEIGDSVNITAVARLLTATAEGMTLLARSRYSKAALADIAAEVLSVVGIDYRDVPRADGTLS
jgi:TetR/AcrR family transcriptional repressor of nem operon